MKYYSEKLKTLFDTEEECATAELKAEKEAAEKKAAEAAANQARINAAKAKATADEEKSQKRAAQARKVGEAYERAQSVRKEAYAKARKTASKAYEEIANAYNAAEKESQVAYDEWRKLVAEFNKEYGGYHVTITNVPDCKEFDSRIFDNIFTDFGKLFKI